MNSNERYEWTIVRFWGGVVLYVMTLGAELINSYNSQQFTVLTIVLPVILLFIAVSIAVISWKKEDEKPG